MYENNNISSSCRMNVGEKRKAELFAKSKKGQETIPGEVVKSLAADLEKYPNWAESLAERMYISVSKVYRIKNLAPMDRSLRSEFVEKGNELLNELRA